jgi:hypothetical protein
MIDPAKLNQLEHPGAWVVYQPHFGNKEVGRIKSWDEESVWVVFKCDDRWDLYKNYTAMMCNPTQLEFAEV